MVDFYWQMVIMRIKRIEQREYEKHGERIRKGGDMYEQHLRFIDFVGTRSLSRIEQWATEVSCPILRLDRTKDISKNAELIMKKYLAMQINELNKHNLQQT